MKSHREKMRQFYWSVAMARAMVLYAVVCEYEDDVIWGTHGWKV